MNYYTPTGKAITDVIEWARLFEDEDGPGTGLPRGRFIGDTKVGPIRVSTVWLGLDHSFGHPYLGEQGEWAFPPILIFETIVFVPKVLGWGELEMYRYSTIEEAVAGHWATVRRARRRWPLMLLRAWSEVTRSFYRRVIRSRHGKTRTAQGARRPPPQV